MTIALGTALTREKFSGFLPTDIDGLQLWLTAAAGTNQTAGGDPCADGQVVGEWVDQSGNGNNATQGTAGDRPIYRSTPDVDFVSNDYLDLNTNFESIFQGSFTIIAKVASDDAQQLISQIIMGLRVSLDRVQLQIDDANSGSVSLVLNDGTTAITATAANYFPNGPTGDFVVTAKFDATTKTTTIYIDGSQEGTDTDAAYVPGDLSLGADNMLLGCRYSGVAQLFWVGPMYCVLLYDTALSDADRALAEAYAAT